MKRIEFKYDRSISAYFWFFRYLVNASLFMLGIYAYLLISHMIFLDDSLADTCAGTLCFTLYYSFDTDEDFAYSISLMAMIFITVATGLLRWIKSDAFRKRAEIYGGKDAKLKKFAALAFNSWDWSVVGETDTQDSRENLANIVLTALSEESKLREAANRTKQ